MTIPEKSASDAEAVAALIWLAFVVPEEVLPLEDDGRTYCSFLRALDTYSNIRARERADREAALRDIAAEREQLLAELEAERSRDCRIQADLPATSADARPPEPVPDSDTVPAAQPPDTHTHTGPAAPKSDDGGKSPAAFVGKSSGEKQRVYARLMGYCAAHGLGSARTIAEAAGGALTDDEVRSMKDGDRLPIQKWRILSAALDWLEENEHRR